VWALPFVVALICLTGASSALAQGTTGTLTGTVVDSSGSAVPGATVTATEAESAAVRTVVSNENGLFRIAGLNPGRYAVKVELTSCKTVTGDDLKNIQMKGRDIYNLLAVLPGVQDTNLNRDYSSWTSATQITINGAPSQNKDVRV